MKKIISTILSLIFVFGLFSITALAAEEYTVKVGEREYLGNSAGNPDYYTDYTEWTLSDETLAEIYENERNDCYITFLKPGRLVVSEKNLVQHGRFGDLKKYLTDTVYNIYHTIKDVKITNLDAPYHNSSLDKEADINEDLQIESIKYTIFNKELDSFSEGDNIAITVKVKCGTDSEYEKIDSSSRAYWAEQKVYSDKTNIINDHEAEYIFLYTVTRGDVGTVENADFNISVPKHGDEFPKEATTSTEGIEITSVVWDTDDKKVNSDKTYTVAIYFDCLGEYRYADNFEEDAVITVNGETTELKKAGSHKYFRYYTEITIQPYDIVQTAHFNITVPKDGEAFPTEATHPLSPGISVKSVEWTPADEKADATKEYTVKIVFSKESTYMWADDFEDQAVVSVNGEKTDLKKMYAGGIKKAVGKRMFYYYTEATIQPEAIVEEKPVVQTAHFNITVPKDGEAFPTEATHPLSPGISVKSVEWTPADEKADATKEYTVKIIFGKESTYDWADDFEAQAVVSVNGKKTELEKMYPDTLGTKKVGKKLFYYYTEATIQPTAVAKDDASGKTDGTGSGTSGSGSSSAGSGSSGSGSSSTGSGSSSTGSGSSGSGSGTKPSGSDSYVFPFVDVPTHEWYYDSVKAAHKMGLINGESKTIYAPENNMTFAEAVKLAACMNILYRGGNPSTDIANGDDLWYSTYMKYALDNGIIDEDLTPRADEYITRKEYAYIFSKALPAEAFAAKNEIPSGIIPDVKEEETAQDKAIYLLYRAGVLAGSDVKGTFNPSAYIIRAEVATILIRMMEPAARVSAAAELGK